MAASDPVDIENVIIKWAKQVFDIAKNKDQARIPKESLQYNVNWRRIRFVHTQPEFVDTQKPPTPKSLVLFKTNFSNHTDQEQEYSFRTQRTTSSACEVVIEQAYTVGYEMNVSLKTPGEVFEASAGFHREMSLTNAQGQTIEEEMSWEVDSQIKVPKKTKTRAELVVSEDQYSGAFSINTTISGTAVVTITNSKENNSLVKVVENNVVEILRSMKDSEKGIKIFTLEKNIAHVTTRGHCNFRYAIEQHVELQEESLE